ncbi:S-adenosyl-L-methionine-dependent methyltransferase, partial [Baffinella frigidus]
MVSKPVVRPPMINRGHYARVAVIRGLEQIVNVGGGLDSTYFCLRAANAAPRGGFFEVDLPDVVVTKTSKIRASPQLQALCTPAGGGAGAGEPGGEGGGLDGEDGDGAGDKGGSCEGEGEQGGEGGGQEGGNKGGYHLVTGDVRELGQLEEALRAAGVDFSAPTLFLSECVLVYLGAGCVVHTRGVLYTPTLFLSECVLVYLGAEQGSEFLAWVARTFQTAGFITYEQVHPATPFRDISMAFPVHPATPFGDMMVKNIAARGCPLRSIHAFPDLPAQARRYTEAGFGFSIEAAGFGYSSEAVTMRDALSLSHAQCSSREEQARIAKEHYCLVFASKDDFAGGGSDAFWAQCG